MYFCPDNLDAELNLNERRHYAAKYFGLKQLWDEGKSPLSAQADEITSLRNGAGKRLLPEYPIYGVPGRGLRTGGLSVFLAVKKEGQWHLFSFVKFWKESPFADNSATPKPEGKYWGGGRDNPVLLLGGLGAQPRKFLKNHTFTPLKLLIFALFSLLKGQKDSRNRMKWKKRERIDV